MLSLQKNIEGKQFYKLLDICFSVSSYVTFTKNQWISENFKDHDCFLNEIKPFYLETINPEHWYCMYTSEENPLEEVYLYKTDEKLKEILKKHHDNLFLRENRIEESTTDRLYEILGIEEIRLEWPDGSVTLAELEDDEWGHIKDLPEDICFFNGNELFLGTLSHEYICDVYPPSDEIREKLLECGDWEEIDETNLKQYEFDTGSIVFRWKE